MPDPYDMSDEELEAAFREAREEENSGSTAFEETPPAVDLPAEDEDQELEDDLETSDADTDEDASEEDGSEQLDDEQDSDTDLTGEEDTDAEDDSEDSEGATEEEDKAPVTEAPKVHVVKANGKTYEITDDEMREQFPRVFSQAMDYTRKMQAIKPWRKTIDAIEGANLQHSDVSLMIDVLKGDKEAIAEVLKRTGVDALDLSTEESNYVAKDYGRDEHTLNLQDVLEGIRSDPEFRITENVINKEWDDASWQVLRASPEKIRQLHVDVKSGLYAKLLPIAEKLKVFDGGTKTSLDYYVDAYREYVARQAQSEEQTRIVEQNTAAQERVTSVKTQTAKRTATAAASTKRKAASLSAPARSSGPVDYLDSSDEDFEAWYARLQENT